MPHSLPPSPIPADPHAPAGPPAPPGATRKAPPERREAAEADDPKGTAAQERCPLRPWGCTAAVRLPNWRLLSAHPTSAGEVEYCQCTCNAIVTLCQGELAAFTGPPDASP